MLDFFFKKGLVVINLYLLNAELSKEAKALTISIFIVLNCNQQNKN
jgi:hypothetical protein